MHFDMTIYIDCSIKLWHSRAWKSLACVIFNNYAYSSQDDILFLRNFVKVKSVFLQKANCHAIYDHVIFFDCDYHLFVQVVNNVILTLEAILSCHAINEQC